MSFLWQRWWSKTEDEVGHHNAPVMANRSTNYNAHNRWWTTIIAIKALIASCPRAWFSPYNISWFISFIQLNLTRRHSYEFRHIISYEYHYDNQNLLKVVYQLYPRRYLIVSTEHQFQNNVWIANCMRTKITLNLLEKTFKIYEVSSIIRPSPLSYRDSLTPHPLLSLVQFAPILF